MLSVSLIIPFMNTIMNPEDIMQKWYARLLCEFFSLDSEKSFLVFLSLVIAVLYIVKNVYLVFEYYIQYRFVYRNQFQMQSRLLNSLLHRPYEYYLGVDSAEIIRLIEGDISQAFQLLSRLLNLFTEMVVSLTLIGTIFFITPLITICMAVVLLILVIVINCIIKPILRQAGERSQENASGMYKWLLQSIQGIKEVIVMRREDFFLVNFNVNGREFVKHAEKNSVLNMIPRFSIEAISMSTMFIVVGFVIGRGKPIEQMIPTLTAVAMAAMRLLPSINRISSSLAAIAFSEPMLDKVMENFIEVKNSSSVVRRQSMENCKPDDERKIRDFKKDIQFKSISYRYPESDRNVFFDANMIIRKGESVGLVGESGAGKTTAVDIILGLLNPEQGSVLVDGVDIEEDKEGWLSLIGYIPQMIFMMDDTIRMNVAFGDDFRKIDDEKVWEALKEASLDDFVKTLPNGLDTEIGERGIRLSGGQRQRIGIARALYVNPSILIFDEATSALDNKTEAEIMESINHLHGSKTMIIIAHRLSTIDNCDHVYRVEDGRISMER